MDTAAQKASLPTPLLETHRADRATIGEWFGCALPSDFGDWLAEYRFARETVALLDKNYRAYLSFAGADRVRFLNAIFTNDIKTLKTGQGIVSLFLNPQGRIQAEIETYAEADRMLCISFAEIREKLVPALDHYIIMDDVTLTDESARRGTLALEGPRAAEVVRHLTQIDLGAMAELEWRAGAVGPLPCRIVRRSPGGNPGAEFICEQSDLAQLWNTLRDAARAAGGGPVGYTALNSLRLEAGVPWFGYDFGEKQIPHEAGLEKTHISYTKGCYTGQEIVERVRSRGHVNRRRVSLLFSGDAVPEEGAPLTTADSKEAGYVTRAARIWDPERIIGMGYLRKEAEAPGTTL